MRKLLCSLLLLASPLTSLGTTIVVDTDEPGFAPVMGNTTLEMAVAASNAGTADTILINYSGVLNLGTELAITMPVTIIGPSASHFVISGTAVPSANNVIRVNTGSATPVRISGLTFSDKFGSAGYMNVVGGTDVVLKNCTFRNNHISLTGSSLLNGGNTIIENVSFFNTSANQGGAVLNTGSLTAHNCSFIDNTATAGHGGAIYSDGGGLLNHCTFYNCQAVGGTSEGGAIHHTGLSAINLTVQSCLFDPSCNATINGTNVRVTPGGVVFFSSGGYNMMDDDNGCSGLFTAAGDQVGGGNTYGLRSTGPVEDGFGLVWIPIELAVSDAVDNGGPQLTVTDCRRAPRQLLSGTDIGACEYTPLRVLNNFASGVGSMADVIGQLNGGLFPAPYYVSFDIPLANTVITNPAGYSIAPQNPGPVIVDGFSQPTSLVPGPQNSLEAGTAGRCPVQLDGTSFASAGINVNSNDVSIWGLTMYSYAEGIRCSGSGTEIAGNYFAYDQDGQDAGYQLRNGVVINVGSTNSIVIGGEQHWKRNSFGGRTGLGDAHVLMFPGNGGGATITNNYFGVTGNGMLAVGGPIADGILILGGADHLIDHNVISNHNFGIQIDGSVTARIEDNRFGTDGFGYGSQPIDSAGVNVRYSGLSLVEIGRPGHGNQFTSCQNGSSTSAGIRLDAANNVNIYANHFGLADDQISPLPNDRGIWTRQSQFTKIGGATIGERNVFCASTVAGIHLDNQTNGVQVMGNTFGLNGLGAVSPGLANIAGMEVKDSWSNVIGVAGAPNYFAQSNFEGIYLNNADTNQIIGNVFGRALNGSPSGAGTDAITMFAGSDTNTVGGTSAGEHNIITNASGHGVFIADGKNNVIQSDSIFNNSGDGIRVDNIVSAANFITSNWIYDNGGLGIVLSNGANHGVPTPELIAATNCTGSGNVTVAVEIPSGPTANYQVEVYRVPGGAGDPSGYGEGNTPYALGPVLSVGATPWTGTFSIPPGIAPGDSISITITDVVLGSTSEFSSVVRVNESFTVTHDSTHNTTCSGDMDGALFITVNGGSSPFNYLWYSGPSIYSMNEDATGLGSGTYDVDVTDTTGCTLTTPNLVVTEPLPVTIDALSVSSNHNGADISCPGATDGAIDITMSGGTGPYDISGDGGGSFPTTGVVSPHTIPNLGAGTYTAVVRDALGCLSSPMPITLNDPPAITLSCSSTNLTCFGSLDGTVTAAGGGGTGTLNYVWSPGPLVGPSHSGLGPNNYVVQVTDANGCIDSCSVSVLEPTDVMVVVNQIDSVTCNGSADGAVDVTVSGGVPGYGYLWEDSGGSPYTNTEDLSSALADTYTYIVTDANGCTDTTTHIVEEPNPLIPGSIVTTNPSCPGGSDGQIDLSTASGGTPGYQYSIDNGTNWQTSPLFTGLSSVVTYTGLVQDANGCVASYGGISLVDPLPNNLAVGADLILCEGDTAALTSALLAGTATGVSWSHNGSGSFSPSGLVFNPLYIPGPGETGVVTMIVQTVGPCTAVTDSMLVTYNPALSAGSDAVDTVCVNVAPIDLTTLIGSADGSGSWVEPITSGGLSGSFFDPSIPNPSTTTTYTFWHILPGLAPCPPDTAEVLITVEPLPNLVVSGSVAICDGDTTTISASGSTGGYTWDQGLGSGATHQVFPTVNTTYTVVTTDPGTGCSNADSLVVTVNPVPFVDTANAVSVHASCPGVADGSITIVATVGSPNSLEYSIDGGSNWQASNFFPGLTAGTYPVHVRDVVTGCTNSQWLFILGNLSNVTQSITLTDPSCHGLADGAIQVSFFGGTAPYSSSIDDGANWNVHSVGATDTTYNGLAAGDYYVTIQDANGCQVVPSDTVQLFDPGPITYDLDAVTICLPDSGSIAYTNVSGGTGPYMFSFDGGSNYQSDPTFYTQATGTYLVSIQDANGCLHDSSIFVAENIPSSPVIVDGNPYCGLPAVVTGTATGTIQWYDDMFNLLGTGNSVTIPGTWVSGDTLYAFNAESGCLSFPEFLPIIVEDNDLLVDAGITACPGDSISLTASGTGMIAWFQDGTIADTSLNTISALPVDDGYYYVALSTGNCVFFDSIYVDINTDDPLCQFNIVNAFSPDGDGVNDIWYIGPADDYPNNTVYIVNRWGDQIVQLENYDNVIVFWDGTNASGDELPPGTYFYVIEYHDIDFTSTGWVQITK